MHRGFRLGFPRSINRVHVLGFPFVEHPITTAGSASCVSDRRTTPDVM
jgi:hypothetical protein